MITQYVTAIGVEFTMKPKVIVTYILANVGLTKYRVKCSGRKSFKCKNPRGDIYEKKQKGRKGPKYHGP